MFVTAQLPEDILFRGSILHAMWVPRIKIRSSDLEQMPLPVELCCQANRAFWVKSSPSSAHALLSAPWLVGS